MEEPKSRLELLPVEAIQAIQCFIDNVPDLASIILTCKAIYNAFVSADQLILKQVLTNEIGFEVLPEALLTALISRQAPFNDYSVDEYGNCFFENGRDIELKAHPNLRVRDGLFLSKLHSHVIYFTNDFISKAFASPIFTRDISIATEQLPVSDKEKWRIQRTFYRFQMYCCIVKVDEKKLLFPFDLESGQNGIFFSYFSVWENEQLACVHDYIFRIVGHGFDELVDHDIAWTEDFRWYASFDSPEEIEARIARGLFAVRDMVEAKSYEQMLKAYKRSYEKPSFFLLDHGLSNSTHGTFPQSEDHEYWLEDFSQEEDDAFIKKPVWCDDEDEGPELIWRWAHSWFHGADFVLCEQHRFEREWGYVMWDYARILQLHVMENEWTKTNTDVYVSGRGSGPPKESLERKWKIYRAGGRGWWSADDESKVVWRGGCAPWDKPVEIQPDRWEKEDLRSIDEAKDFIKSLRLQLP